MTENMAAAPVAGAPSWPRRPPSRYDTEVWPDRSAAAASPALLAGALAAGGFGATVLPYSLPGVGLVLTVAAAMAAAWSAVRTRRSRTTAVFGGLAVLLVAVPAIRSAPWIVALSTAAAVAMLSYALAGGSGWLEVVFGSLSLAPAAERMLGWLGRGVRAHRPPRTEQMIAVFRALAIGFGLVAGFGLLLVSADALFGEWVARAAPDISAERLPVRVLAFLLVTTSVLAVGYLATNRPRWNRLATGEPSPARPIEWVLPIVLLDLLLAGFAAAQATVLVADDRDALLRSTGLTYAEYARRGFFQLVVVTIGVLLVIAVAVRKQPARTGRMGTLARSLLGVLCALSLLVVAAAVGRMMLYEDAYGLTRLRLWVHAVELWLGVVIVLVAAAGVIRLRNAWLPRAVAGTGAVGLLVLGAINPDALIAGSQVDRYERTGRIDIGYLSSLSPDAVPALDRLPEPLRSCALTGLVAQAGLDRDQPWTRWSVGRQRAEDAVADRPLLTALPWTCRPEPPGG